MSETIRTKVGMITYLAPTGPIDSEPGLLSVREASEESIRARDVNIVIDLSRVPLVTGVVLDCLLDVQDALSKMGGGLKVMNANSLIMDIFRITGFENYVEVMERA